ncbi:FAD-dependent oxidoreductase [Streptomyces sp. NPDC048639]|uniref:FAD-dependent oxidoreductase n=1 Tax=Streptomyces sp. NPDC048639 TaxID=3365581 RepID=UPI00371B77BB
MAEYISDHAVVLGGSIAGLLAARVLADAYARVTVVDRDVLTGTEGPRRSIPQGRQIHGLQPRGQEILEDLFPGFTDEMAAHGAQIQDTVNQGHWYFRGRLLRKAPSDLVTVAASRPLLEARIRDRVLKLPEVSFLEEHDIIGLTTTPDRGRVTGARVHPRASGGAVREIPADLIVDATGRGTRTPLWLAGFGYPDVEEERLEIGVGYATRHYRLPPGTRHDGRATIVIASPEDPRGAICAEVEGGRIQLAVNGILGDFPPTDPDGFERYVKSLPVPALYELTQEAEPLDDPVAHRFPVSLRRRYEKMARFPDRLLVTGDSVCSFNPVYAQGMTVAALGAMVLRRHLRAGHAPQPLPYLSDLAREAVSPSWEANAVNDLQFAGVRGERTLKTRMIQAYGRLVQAAAAHDPDVAHAFVRVLSLADPGTALMSPAVLLRVLRHRTAGVGR